MPNGYAIVDEDGWGRYICTTGDHKGFARDLSYDRDHELMDRVKREGQECVSPSETEGVVLPCRKEDTPEKLIIIEKKTEQPKLFDMRGRR